MIKPSLSIVISTISNNINYFLKRFNFHSLEDADEVLIIIQGEGIMPCLDDDIFKKYNVIIEKKIGLSVSRNLGIKHSSCEYIWFMDDDIILNNDAVNTVKESLNKNHPDVLTVRTLFDNDSPYKNYTNRISMKKLDIINISSVEIIVSRSKLIKCKIRFNEMLGLGASYPTCEENIFLLDLYDQGAKMIHADKYVQKHPVKKRSSSFKDNNILIGKGIFCNKYGGITGLLILTYWVFKAVSINGMNLMKNYNLIYGYKNAKSIIG